LYILYIPLSYLFWIGEIVWMDFLAYDVYHKGEMDWDVRNDEGRRVGGVREEGDGDEKDEDEDGEKKGGEDEQDEWQDTDEDEDENESMEGVERPSTPPQQIGIENERVDSVMAGQPDRGKGASTAWDEGASPKPRNGYIDQRDDGFGLE
jgi:hypothetical protein